MPPYGIWMIWHWKWGRQRGELLLSLEQEVRFPLRSYSGILRQAETPTSWLRFAPRCYVWELTSRSLHALKKTCTMIHILRSITAGHYYWRNEQPLVDPDISWIFLGKRHDTNMSTEQKYIAGELYKKPQKTTWEDHVHYGVIDRHRTVIFTRFIKVAPGKVSIYS